MRIILILFIPILVLPLYADTKREALKSLEIDLRSHIIEMEENRYVFHYRNISKSSIKELKESADSFQLTPYTGGQMGSGLYAASNPFVSAYYGGVRRGSGDGNWNLAVITLLEGDRYLNIHMNTSGWSDGNRIYLSEETQIYLENAYSCIAPKGEVHFTRAFFYNPNCLRVLKDFVKLYNIKGVIYDWYKSEIIGCSRSSSAVVIYDSSSLNTETIKNFNKDSKTNSLIQKYLLTAAKENKSLTFGFGVRSSFLIEAWANLDLSFTDDEGYLKWKGKILNCD